MKSRSAFILNPMLILVGVVIVLVLLVMPLNPFKLQSFSATHTLKWKGYDLLIESSTGFKSITSGGGCGHGTARVNPFANRGTDIYSVVSYDSAIVFDSLSYSSSCSAHPASMAGTLFVPNPNTYTEIFVSYSSEIKSEGGSSSTSASVSNGVSSFTLSRDSCSGGCSKSNPHNVLIKIADGYATIPSVPTTFKIDNSKPFIFSFGADADATNANGINARAYLTLDNIEVKKLMLPPPSKLSPSVLSVLINSIVDFITDIFKRIFALSITGSTSPLAGTTQSYSVNIQLPTKTDKDYLDGTFTQRYFNWALVDDVSNIVQEGTYIEMDDTYNTVLSVNIPNKAGKYALIGIVVETTGQYQNGQWVKTNEEIVYKEASNFQSKIIVPPKLTPSFSLKDIIGKILEFIKGLFGIR